MILARRACAEYDFNFKKKRKAMKLVGIYFLEDFEQKKKLSRRVKFACSELLFSLTIMLMMLTTLMMTKTLRAEAASWTVNSSSCRSSFSPPSRRSRSSFEYLFLLYLYFQLYLQFSSFLFVFVSEHYTSFFRKAAFFRKMPSSCKERSSPRYSITCAKQGAPFRTCKIFKVLGDTLRQRILPTNHPYQTRCDRL